MVSADVQKSIRAMFGDVEPRMIFSHNNGLAKGTS